ncbi:cation diffusion facilitator family transporter [Candidatus Palauibacter sp.]|uniref:cation diffusion facilitator family transporter n=1 Tax=Candidatus Palauibacter sp. TaxID=3101350 RepID=UPI003B524CC1
MTTALVIIASFMFVEVVGGILSGSLALIADAGHMLTDAASIGLALFAVHFATRAASVERTFGYHRLEILAALINALTLWLISAWVIFEAYHRFQEIPEVEGGLMLIVGTLGLLANLAAAWVLHRSAKHSVNVEGALAHVIADLLGSVAVIISGVLVWAFEWHISDPILSVLIGVLILLSTWRLLAKVVHVLLEGTPKHVDVYRLCHEIEDLEGVTVIHDVHVWTLAPGYDALTAHVLVDPEHERDTSNLLHEIQEIAYNKFNVQHITVQLEGTASSCREDHHVDHLVATARPH